MKIEHLRRLIRVQIKAVARATGSRKVEQEKILAGLRKDLEKLTEI